MKAGFDVTTAAGATMLANDIESKTGERLAANTIKRLVGVIPYNNKPRITTLNIIARYLGWPSWESLMNDHRSSAFGGRNPFFTTKKLRNTIVKFKWEPDREITLIHLSRTKYKVLESINSQLQAGDILCIDLLADKCPFFAKDVIRNGEHLGTYAAATENGIFDLTVNKK